jgi:1-aminocyclopropane-1-carboxylate deaminase/D-cysteine desulfhydrase-like pyridoxal-dependent ACC family enzyme
MILATPDDYLSMVEGWEDPNPLPIITQEEGIYVVRDDLLGGGSKMRFIDHMIEAWPYKEFVYGSSPATGYAQISFAKAAVRHGKKAVIFMAQRDMNKLHPYQQEAIASGADMRWVPNGMLSVTEKRAKDYVKEDPSNRVLIPIGGDHPDVLACIVKVARYNIGMIPDEVWTVGSSGTLTRGLQLAWPETNFNVVTVGHKGNYGRAKIYECEISFNKPTKFLPPFPSAPTYDAKAWEFIKKYASRNKTVLFWNVGA